MASRNVDLLIRARDNASRAFKSVSDALEELNAIQAGVASNADKMDSALSKSRTSAKAVAASIGGDVARGVDKAAQVFQRIETSVTDATRQFERQKRDLAESQEAYRALGRQADAAREAIVGAAIAARESGGDREQVRLRAAQQAYKGINQEIARLSPRLEKQENDLEKNVAELDRVRSAATAATAALREVGRANQRAQGLGADQSRTQAANDAARRGIGQLSNAEKALLVEIDAREAAAEAAAFAATRANAETENSIRDLVKAEERLAAIQARRAAIEQARVANSSARSGLAGITAGLVAKTRAEENASKAAEAGRRASEALAASYERQRAAAQVSATDQAKLAQSYRQAFTAAQQYTGPLRSVYQEIVRLGPATASAAQGVNRLTGRMTDGRQVFRAFYGDSRRALSLMQRMRGEVLSLTASFVGFYGVFNVGSGILQAFQQLEAAQNRLGAAFNQDYDRVNAELARLNSEASRLGISFDVLADNYSKFIISGQQAGLETTQLQTIFRQVSEAGRVLKLSNDQIAGTFTALTQIAGKGTLQMEELRQQLGDRLPGAVGLLAQALGYGEDELAKFYKDVENGAVSAEEALVALGQGLEDQFGGQLEDALDSVTAKIGNLQNLLFQRQLTAANSGFISGLETALDALNEWLDSPEGIEFFEALGAAFGQLFEVLPVVLDNMDTLTGLMQAFVAIKVGQVVSGLGASFTQLGRVTVGNMRVQVALNRVVAAYSPAAAAALRSTTALGVGLRGLRATVASVAIGFRALWAAIGGPIGIAAAALSLFAFQSIGGVDDSMQQLNRTMQDADETLGQVAQAFREAGGDAEKFRDKLDQISRLDLELDVRNLREQFDQQLNGSRDTVTGLNTEVQKLRRSILNSTADPAAVTGMLGLIYQFNDGEISARDLREEIESLADKFRDLSEVEGLDDFLDWLDSLAAAEEKIERLEAELAVIDGTADDAQKAIAGLGEAVDQAAKQAEEARERMSVFEAAMRELGEHIPSINEKLKQFDAMREIEADFQAALKAADAFTDGAQRAAAIASAVDLRNQAYNGLYDGQVQGYSGSNGVDVAAQFIRDREAFRSTPYYDVNAYRVGYGSDTITLSDGTVQRVTQGMTVSVADANRDLYRRITTEFFPKVIEVAGRERFNSFNAQQQASLGSVAYNYGEIPDRIADAVRNGTAEEIAAAIRSLAGDNGGVNRGRRNLEAALFTSSTGVESAEAEFDRSREEQARQAEQRVEKQREFRDGLQEEIAQTEFLNSLEGQRLIDAEVAKAIREAENEAKAVGLQLTEQERQQIEEVTRAKFANRQAEEDRNAQLEKARDLEEQANLLQERRRFLIEQITQLEGQGRFVEAAGLTEELENVEVQLQQALDAAVAFWEALGGDGSERALFALRQTQSELGR